MGNLSASILSEGRSRPHSGASHIPGTIPPQPAWIVVGGAGGVRGSPAGSAGSEAQREICRADGVPKRLSPSPFPCDGPGLPPSHLPQSFEQQYCFGPVWYPKLL